MAQARDAGHSQHNRGTRHSRDRCCNQDTWDKRHNRDDPRRVRIPDKASRIKACCFLAAMFQVSGQDRLVDMGQQGGTSAEVLQVAAASWEISVAKLQAALQRIFPTRRTRYIRATLAVDRSACFHLPMLIPTVPVPLLVSAIHRCLNWVTDLNNLNSRFCFLSEYSPDVVYLASATSQSRPQSTCPLILFWTFLFIRTRIAACSRKHSEQARRILLLSRLHEFFPFEKRDSRVQEQFPAHIKTDR